MVIKKLIILVDPETELLNVEMTRLGLKIFRKLALNLPRSQLNLPKAFALGTEEPIPTYKMVRPRTITKL